MIRHANVDDAKPLATLAESTFRAAFGDQNTARDLDLHCRASFSEALQAAEIANIDMATFIAEGASRFVGFAQIRWGNWPECIDATFAGEVLRLYVVNEWHGKGIARALMSACLEALAKRGHDMVWLGVWEKNPRAVAFYRKFGFREVGEHIFQLGTDPQRDIIMARSVIATT
jgi:ribosomal protein S18 acetylase RimI-like enzyme